MVILLVKLSTGDPLPCEGGVGKFATGKGMGFHSRWNS